MKWPDAEATLRTLIEAEWAASAYAATMPLSWENELIEAPIAQFMHVTLDGTFAEKTIYGGVGKRSSIEGGIIFYHAFVPVATGKATALGAVDAMTTILELRVIDSDIRLDGANPPSPVEMTRDQEIPTAQPNGMYWRCSGSVPFIVTDIR